MSACRARSDDVFAEAVFTAVSCGLKVTDLDVFVRGVRGAADDQAALRYLEVFEAENHQSSASRPASPASAARKLAMDICALDPNSVAAAVIADHRKATLDQLKRAATKIAQMAVAIESQAA